MRITRDTLIKAARATTAEKVRYNRHLICVYLTGSLVEEEALLGGTADIDLIFVHDSEPSIRREIVPITDDVHVDIAHLSQGRYQQPRSLRGEPWLGTFLCFNPIVLHDTQHWFEFNQASVCAQFHQPENTMRRSQTLAESARQNWMSMHAGQKGPWAETVLRYLDAVKNAANSIASLSGPPLTERRFMLQFPERARRAGQPDLSDRLTGLFAGEFPVSEDWQAWLGSWEAAFLAAGRLENAPAHLHPARRNYYRKAAETLWENEEHAAAVWPVLRTWTEAVVCGAGPEAEEAWQAAIQQVGLDEADFSDRLQALDSYLDSVEEILDVWGAQQGA